MSVAVRDFDYAGHLALPALERRARYHHICISLERAIEHEFEPVSRFVDFMVSDRAAFDTTDVLSMVRDLWPQLHSVYTANRSNRSRSTEERRLAALNTILQNWGPEGRDMFRLEKYDKVRLAVRVSRSRALPIALQQVDAIVKDRLRRPRAGISTNTTPQNRDWQILADQILEEKVTQETKVLGLTSPYASADPAFSSSQDRPPTPDTPTPQRGDKRPRPESDSFQHGPQPPPPPQTPDRQSSAGPSQARMPGRRADAAHSDGAEPPTGAEPSESGRSSRQVSSRLSSPPDEIQNPEDEPPMHHHGESDGSVSRGRVKISARVLAARARERCDCEEFPKGPSRLWKTDLHTVLMEKNIIRGEWLFATLFYSNWIQGACGFHLRMVEEAIGMKPCDEKADAKDSLHDYWEHRKDDAHYRQEHPDCFCR